MTGVNGALGLLAREGENGQVIEHRGRVIGRSGGLVPTITCTDPVAEWDKIGVQWVLNNATLGTILRTCVENPTGACATGIICHIDEPIDSSPAVATSVYPTIKQGSKGDYVKKAQDLLNSWGCSPQIDVSGTGYGRNTWSWPMNFAPRTPVLKSWCF